MSIFLARVYDQKSSNPIFGELTALIKDFTPSPNLTQTVTTFDRPGFEFFFSNPGVDISNLYYEDDSHVIFVSGECRKPGSSKKILARDLVELVRDKELKSFGGYYLIFSYEKKSQQVIIWNTLSRAVPAYFSQKESELIVSNRSSLVSVVHERGRPVVNLENIFPFALQGFFPSEQCLFKDVNVIPANTQSTLSANKKSFIDIDDSLDNFSSECKPQEIFDEISSELSLAAAHDSRNEIRIGLTGGFDSRLIAAAIKKSGADFIAFTKGIPTHPDCYIAKEVADALEIKHIIQKPTSHQSPKKITVDPTLSTLKTLYFSDWHVFGYDRLGQSSETYNDALIYKGSGGEMMRGGYPLIMQKGNNIKGTQKFNKFWEDRGVLTPLGKEIIDIKKEEAYRPFIGLDAIDALDKMYLLYRNGRWGSATYMANQSVHQKIPFMDNEFLKLVYRVPGELRCGQYLHYEILKRLNNNLVKIPFFAKTYPFVGNPLPGYEDIVASIPPPVSAKEKSKSLFNWRFAMQSPLGVRMRETILSNFSEHSQHLVNIGRLEALINEAISSSEDRALGKAMWGLFSAALAMKPLTPSEFPDEEQIDIEIQESIHF